MTKGCSKNKRQSWTSSLSYTVSNERVSLRDSEPQENCGRLSWFFPPLTVTYQGRVLNNPEWCPWMISRWFFLWLDFSIPGALHAHHSWLHILHKGWHSQMQVPLTFYPAQHLSFPQSAPFSLLGTSALRSWASLSEFLFSFYTSSRRDPTLLFFPPLGHRVTIFSTWQVSNSINIPILWLPEFLGIKCKLLTMATEPFSGLTPSSRLLHGFLRPSEQVAVSPPSLKW